MKHLSFLLVLCSTAWSALAAQEHEEIQQIIETLESLSNEESRIYYGSLSQETKDAIADVRRTEAMRVREEIAFAQQKEFEILAKGTFPLLDAIWLNYEAAVERIVNEIDDAEIKQGVQKQAMQPLQAFALILEQVPPPLAIEVWEEHQDRIESFWKSFNWNAVDVAALREIEKSLIDPLLPDLQKIIDAEPDKDTRWMLRKKWKHLFIPPQQDGVNASD